MSWNDNAPIVVGGLGGSGTRVVAQLMRDTGIYIGDYLNESLDNLWFTLLLRRPNQIENPNDKKLLALLDIFHQRMQGNSKWKLEQQNILWSCAYDFVKDNYVASQRISFPLTTLKSFYRNYSLPSRLNWGWKEPNSHIFLELLLERFPQMKYVHVIRHPLDLVYGSNQLQLKNWKHLFRIAENDTRKAMLLYYRAANNRAIDFGKRLGGKFLLIKIEDLCSEPQYWVDRLLTFWNIELDEKLKQQLYRIPNREQATAKYLNKNYSDIDNLASSVAEEFGYTKSFAVNG